MAPKNLQAAFARVRHESPAARHILWALATITSSLLAPLILLLFGVLAYFFTVRQLPNDSIPLGRFLTLPVPEALTKLNPPGQLVALVVIGVLLAIALAITVWISYRGVLQRAGEATESLYQKMLQRMLDRAHDEGVASQRWKAQQLIEKSLPQVRVGLIAWWRALPRAPVLFLSCGILAILIDPWMTLLAATAGLLIWRLLLWLRDEDEEQTSNWELPETQRHLIETLQQAPLLARIQPAHGIDLLYNQQIRTLRQVQQRIDGRWARWIPAVGLAFGLAFAILSLVLGGTLLDPSTGLNLPAAMVLVLSVLTSALAAGRLLTLWQELGPARLAADAVYSFLDFYRSQPSSIMVGLPMVREGVRFDRVSLQDVMGTPLLDRVSMELRPGEVVALMGVESVGLQAMVELLMGYGKPSGGKLAFDGIDVTTIHPHSLSKQVIWVAADGPLWSGSVEDNIRAGGDASLDRIVTVCRDLGLYAHLQALPEGLSTIISPGEGRLSPPASYAIGLARAIVKQPAVVVLQEPPRDTAEVGDDLVAAGLQQLANTGSIVVVLPRRINTLRQADRVVLIHHGQIHVEGTHAHLLENNDLYRHLNYLLFNPYRQLKDSALR